MDFKALNQEIKKTEEKIKARIDFLGALSKDLYGDNNFHSDKTELQVDTDPKKIKELLSNAIPGIVSVEGVEESTDPSKPDSLVVLAKQPYSEDDFTFTHKIPLDKLHRVLERDPLPKEITKENIDDIVTLVKQFSEDTELRNNHPWGRVERDHFLYETELMKKVLQTVDSDAVSFSAFVKKSDNDEVEIRYQAHYGNGFTGVRYISLSNLIQDMKNAIENKSDIQIESELAHIENAAQAPQAQNIRKR